MDELNYKAIIKVVAGPIKARFLMDVCVTETKEPEIVRTTFKGDEDSRASGIIAENSMHLTEIDSDTTSMTYESEIMLTGRLGRYGSGMIGKLAQRQAKQFEEAFTALAEG